MVFYYKENPLKHHCNKEDTEPENTLHKDKQTCLLLHLLMYIQPADYPVSSSGTQNKKNRTIHIKITL